MNRPWYLPLAESAAAFAAVVPDAPLMVMLATVLGVNINDRKANRLDDLLQSMVREFEDNERELNTQFIRTEDFEELFENTATQVMGSHSSSKREAYKNILLGAMSGDFPRPYEVAERYNRTVNQLQEAHFAVLRAMLYKPTEQEHIKVMGASGSVRQTLQNRLDKETFAQAEVLIEDLRNERITSINGLNTTMTGSQALNLRDYLTAYGKRFVEYVMRA